MPVMDLRAGLNVSGGCCCEAMLAFLSTKRRGPGRAASTEDLARGGRNMIGRGERSDRRSTIWSLPTAIVEGDEDGLNEDCDERE